MSMEWGAQLWCRCLQGTNQGWYKQYIPQDLERPGDVRGLEVKAEGEVALGAPWIAPSLSAGADMLRRCSPKGGDIIDPTMETTQETKLPPSRY